MRSSILYILLAAMAAATMAGCKSTCATVEVAQNTDEDAPIEKGRVKKQQGKKQQGKKQDGKQQGVKDERAEKPGGSLAKACSKLGVSSKGVKNQNLYIVSASWLGTRYKYGGMSRSGVDCSGFTSLVYKSVYKKNLTHNSASMLTECKKRVKKGELREGDLVFFRTDGKRTKTPNHVGIYLKENKFVHASTSKGVVVSSMAENYYVSNFITAGRAL